MNPTIRLIAASERILSALSRDGPPLLALDERLDLWAALDAARDQQRKEECERERNAGI